MINFRLFFEAFETVSKLFSDPQHKDKEWEELQKDFIASGGKEIGSGSYGRVFTHPSWPYVVKMFPHDDPYLSFARYAYKHPHPSFPKFYGPPIRITPEFTRVNTMGEVYLSRIEKLKPISPEVWDELNSYEDTSSPNYNNDYNFYRFLIDRPEYAKLKYGPEYTYKLKEYQKKVATIPNNIRSALDAMTIIDNEAQDNPKKWGVKDWKSNNIMQRDNGDIVIVDPVAVGWDRLAAQREQERMERDYYGGGEEPGDMFQQLVAGELKPGMVRGGKLPKNKKFKKPIYKKSILDVPTKFTSSF